VDEFRLLALGPWIVSEAETDAIRVRRVSVEQENVYGVRSGIGQVHFTENLEGLRGSLA
jgi:hypothetical protein